MSCRHCNCYWNEEEDCCDCGKSHWDDDWDDDDIEWDEDDDEAESD